MTFYDSATSNLKNQIIKVEFFLNNEKHEKTRKNHGNGFVYGNVSNFP